MTLRIKRYADELGHSLAFFRLERFLSKSHPLEIIFVIALIAIIFGTAAKFLNIFAWIGGFVIILFLIFWAMAVRD